MEESDDESVESGDLQSGSDFEEAVEGSDHDNQEDFMMEDCKTCCDGVSS